MAEIRIDSRGNRVVVISDILFKGKKHIDWKKVEDYLQIYVGHAVEVMETREIIHLGKKFPDEYAGSRYTRTLKGGYAKAKANATQGILEMIQIATKKDVVENRKEKHNVTAAKGWYYFRTTFAIQHYQDEIATGEYSVYSGRLVMNYTVGGKLYLYDLVEIKKEACNLFNNE